MRINRNKIFQELKTLLSENFRKKIKWKLIQR
jgi:hypothetical protein